ncbi:hypothetical protein ACS0TY_003571 [Phlomoides rotata]
MSIYFTSTNTHEMGSMASSGHLYRHKSYKRNHIACLTPPFNLTLVSHHKLKRQQQEEETPHQTSSRREIILRCSEVAVLGAIFHLSGTKPNYLGVHKSPPGLALCPATNNCVSTSENMSDLTHYAPPWNYNPDEGGGRKKAVSKEEAMQELLEVIKSTKPDNFTPKITEKRDDYVRVEYESPILGFVDDVEFWFPPGKKWIVQYRSASRLGNFDFDVNRKRIKVMIFNHFAVMKILMNMCACVQALRVALENKGWASENSF